MVTSSDAVDVVCHFGETKHEVTFDEKVSVGGSGASHELVLAPVSKMNIADGERVRELSAADLTTVRRLDLHPVFKPFVGDPFVVDGDLKGDGVSLLSVQVLQHGGDQDGCREEPRSVEADHKHSRLYSFVN